MELGLEQDVERRNDEELRAEGDGELYPSRSILTHSQECHLDYLQHKCHGERHHLTLGQRHEDLAEDRTGEMRLSCPHCGRQVMTNDLMMTTFIPLLKVRGHVEKRTSYSHTFQPFMTDKQKPVHLATQTSLHLDADTKAA